MKFGVWYAAVMTFAGPEGARAIACGAERAGFESLWTGEHVVMPAAYESVYPYSKDGRVPGGGAAEMADPLVWYAFAAALTERLRFTTGILVLPQRNPLVVAKQAATLDRLSGGRFSLGVGVGWLREEFEALGAPFEGRGQRHDDYVGALRALWSEPEASYASPHVSFQRARLTPRPTAPIPIVVGGHSQAAARRAGRIGDGFFPAKGSPEELSALFKTARTSAREAGRDPDALELTVADPAIHGPHGLDLARRYQELGAHRILVPPPSFDVHEIGPGLQDLRERVIARMEE
jgi:probable F420-dependent oxidoreductase